MSTTKSTLFVVNKDKWHTKEHTGKSIKNVVCTSQAEATSNSKKIKPVALGIVELHWSELVSQSVSQSVSRKFC